MNLHLETHHWEKHSRKKHKSWERGGNRKGLWTNSNIITLCPFLILIMDNYSANDHPYCLPLSTNDSFSHCAALCCCSLPHLYSPRECILIAADDDVSRGQRGSVRQTQTSKVSTWVSLGILNYGQPPTTLLRTDSKQLVFLLSSFLFCLPRGQSLCTI